MSNSTTTKAQTRQQEDEVEACQQREVLLKKFISHAKSKASPNTSLIVAAGLARFANFLTSKYPLVASFTMHLDEVYVHPLPDSIVFFDAQGQEIGFVETGENPEPLDKEIFGFLAGVDLNGIENYLERVLYIDTLNAWRPGD